MSNTIPADSGAGAPEIQASSPNVVAFQRRKKVENAEQYLTDSERRELREVLAYMRTMRPQFQALATGCPMARRLLEDES